MDKPPRESDKFDQIVNSEVFQGAFSEPVVQNAINQARKYNRESLGQSLAVEEYGKKVRTLDEQLSMFIGQRAVAHGNMTFLDMKQAEPSVLTKYYDEQEVIFNGFGVLDDDESVMEGRKIVLSVARPMTSEEAAQAGCREGLFLAGTADVDGVSLEFNVVTPEYAQAWLVYHHPDLIKQIDTRLSEAGEDEWRAVSSISDMTIDFNQLLIDSGAKDGEMLRAGLESYVNAALKFDQDAPYIITVNGDMLRFSEKDDKWHRLSAQESTNRLFGSIDAIVVAPVIDGPIGVYSFCLNTHTLERDRNEEGGHIVIPISSVASLESVRAIIYDSL